MRTRIVLVISACFLLTAMPALSQSDTGKISGRATGQISSQTSDEKDDVEKLAISRGHSLMESAAPSAGDHLSAVDLTAGKPSRDDAEEPVFGNYTGVLTKSFFSQAQATERDFTGYDTFTDIASESTNDWQFWPDNSLLPQYDSTQSTDSESQAFFAAGGSTTSSP